MTLRSARTAAATLLALAGVSPLNAYGVRRTLVFLVALCPTVLSAWAGQWDLFERSGALTSAIGLIIASRRYVERSVLELAVSNANDERKSELLEDVFTAKLGLALAAFGTIIWGWGQYLRWWSFGYLLIWAFFALWDAERDATHLQRREVQATISAALRGQ